MIDTRSNCGFITIGRGESPHMDVATEGNDNGGLESILQSRQRKGRDFPSPNVIWHSCDINSQSMRANKRRFPLSGSATETLAGIRQIVSGEGQREGAKINSNPT